MADRTVTADLIGRDRMSPAFDSAGRSAEKNGTIIGRVGSVLGTAVKAGAVAAAGGLFLVGRQLVQGVKDAASYQTLQAKTAAVLKSTGNVARTSGEQIRKLAGELEGVSGVDEELIINSQNVLLTFTKVRNEVGRGNDIFNQASRTILDMSVALGTDLQGATLQVGKALNDPIKGITALQRAGVSFTAQQKEQITTLVESGRTLDAQKMILRELQTEFGGAAEAAGKGFEGSLARAKDAVSDLGREVGTELLPVVTRAADWFATTGADKIRGFVSTVRTDVIPGIRRAMSGIGDQLPDIDLSGIRDKVVEQFKGWGPRFVKGIKDGIVRGDWSGLGQTIVDGIFAGAKLTGEGVGRFTAAIGQWAQQVDWFALGMDVGSKAGPFAVGFVAKLGDGLFTAFKEHPFDFAVGIASFLGVGKIAGVISKIFARIPLLRALAPFFAKWNDLTGPINGAVGRFVGDIFRGFAHQFARIFPATEGLLARRLRGLADSIALRAIYAAEAALKWVRGIPTGIGKGLASVTGAVAKVIARLTSPFVSAGQWLVSEGGALVRGLANGIRSAMGRVGSAIAGARRAVLSPLSGAGSWLYGAGQRVISGLVSGIRSQIGAVRSAISEAASVVRGFWPFSPAKEGPLKAYPMDKAGANIVTGLVDGITSERNRLRAGVGALADDVVMRTAGGGADTAVSLRGGAVGGGGPTYVVHVNVTQPLGTPQAVAAAVSDSFHRTAPGSVKPLPPRAVGR